MTTTSPAPSFGTKLVAGINTLAEQTKESNSIQAFAKVIQNALSLASSLSKTEQIKSGLGYVTPVTDTFKILNFFSSVSGIIADAQVASKSAADTRIKTFTIIGHVSELAISILTSIKACGQIGLVNLAKVSKALGSIPVIGKALTLIPFGAYIFTADIVNTIARIATSSIDITNFSADMQLIQDKINLWSNLTAVPAVVGQKVIKEAAAVKANPSAETPWTASQAQFSMTNPQTEALFAKKKEKWQNRRYNRPLKKLKAQKQIVVGSGTSVTLLGCIAVGAAGLPLAAPLGATAALAYLIMSIVELANNIHNKFWIKEKPVAPVPVTQYITPTSQ